MATSLEHIPEAAGWEPKYPFDLAIVYEDRSTRGRALQLYDHLAQQLLDDYDFQCSWWKCGLLDEPALFEQAVEAAANANMIVISMHAAKGVPSSIQRWIDAWSSCRDTRVGALVALFGVQGPEDQELVRVQAALQRTARASHLDFFAHTFRLGDAPPRLSPPQLWEREHRVTPVLQDILRYHPPSPRWGINE